MQKVYFQHSRSQFPSMKAFAPVRAAFFRSGMVLPRAIPALLVVCCVSACKYETTASEAVRKVSPVGIYAFSGPKTPFSVKESLLALPYVDGITAYVTWKTLEPVEGTFDFSFIDQNIERAKFRGKKVTIGVFTGKNAIPDWVFEKGVQHWVSTNGDSLILPSDSLFIEIWRARVEKLGQRYDSDTTVSHIAICGPAGTLCGPRYPELPPQVTFNQLVTRWVSITDMYRNAFPKTTKSLEVHLTIGMEMQLTEAVFMAVPKDENFGPFAEFLSPTAPQITLPTGITYAALAGEYPWSGFQMVSPQGEMIDEALAHGRSFGCRYFEIYEGDLLNFGHLITR